MSANAEMIAFMSIFMPKDVAQYCVMPLVGEFCQKHKKFGGCRVCVGIGCMGDCTNEEYFSTPGDVCDMCLEREKVKACEICGYTVDNPDENVCDYCYDRQIDHILMENTPCEFCGLLKEQEIYTGRLVCYSCKYGDQN